jgi:hypothetical protein
MKDTELSLCDILKKEELKMDCIKYVVLYMKSRNHNDKNKIKV